jgi:hypothetical protein
LTRIAGTMKTSPLRAIIRWTLDILHILHFVT